MQPIGRLEDRTALRVLYGLATLFCVLVLLKAVPLGMPGHWVCAYRETGRLLLDMRMVLLGGVAGVFAAMIPTLWKHRRTAGALLAATVAMVSVNVMLHRPANPAWTYRVMPFTFCELTPHFHASLRIKGLGDYLEYHRVIQERGYWNAPRHLRRLATYPPGLPMVYSLATRAGTATGPWSRWLGRAAGDGMAAEGVAPDLLAFKQPDLLPKAAVAAALHLLVTAMLPFAVFLLARAAGHARDGSLAAAAACCLVPSFTLFTWSSSALTPVLTAAQAALFLMAATRNRLWPAAASGLLLAFGAFLSYSFVPLGLFCMALLVLARTGQTPRRKAIVALAFAGGIAAGTLILGMAGHDSFASFIAVMRNNRSFYEREGRSWFMAALFNPVEFAVFAGPVWAALFLRSLAKELRGLPWRKPWLLPNGLEPACAFTVSLALTLAAALCSGAVRGEVGRNSMNLLPLLLCAVAGPAAKPRMFMHLALASLLILLAMTCAVEATFGFWLSALD